MDILTIVRRPTLIADLPPIFRQSPEFLADHVDAGLFWLGHIHDRYGKFLRQRCAIGESLRLIASEGTSSAVTNGKHTKRLALAPTRAGIRAALMLRRQPPPLSPTDRAILDRIMVGDIPTGDDIERHLFERHKNDKKIAVTKRTVSRRIPELIKLGFHVGNDGNGYFYNGYSMDIRVTNQPK